MQSIMQTTKVTSRAQFTSAIREILDVAKSKTDSKGRVVVYSHIQGDYFIVSTGPGIHRFDFSGFTCEKEVVEYIELATDMVAKFISRS